MSQLNYFNEWQDSLINEINKNIHTALPARVINYDNFNNKANIQVMLHKTDSDDNKVEIPPFFNVPVWQYRNNNFIISLPIKTGDYGFVIFFERDIDNYKNDGIPRIPVNERMHSYNDGIFIPGFYSFNNTPSDLSTDNLVLRSIDGNIELHLTNNNELEVKQNNITKLKLNTDGNFTVSGNINVIGDVIADGVSLTNHIHGGVKSGGSFTSGPV